MTVQDADLPLPSVAEAVITVVPVALAVILPAVETEATVGADDDHDNTLFEAFEGFTVGLSVSDDPMLSVVVDLLRLILVTSCVTVTEHDEDFPSAVALTVVVPGPTAVTLPAELTVATDVLVEDQVTLG